MNKNKNKNENENKNENNKDDQQVDKQNQVAKETTNSNTQEPKLNSEEDRFDRAEEEKFDPMDFPPSDPDFYGDFPPGMGPHGGMNFGPPQPSALPDDREKELSSKTDLTQDELFEWLKPVEDPELFMSVVELGLVYTIKHESETTLIEMTLTSPGCPAGDYIIGSIQQRMEMHPLVKSAEVKLVWEPKWDPREMASEEAKDALGIW